MAKQHNEIQPLFYSTKTVCKMLDVSRAYLYEAVQAGNFPKPVKVGRLNRYKAVEIQAYINQLKDIEINRDNLTSQKQS